MKTNTITKTQDLIDALKSNRLSRLVWQMGSRPAVKGSYWIDSVRVYTSAVHGAEKIGALKCIRGNFISRQYVLTPKFQKVNPMHNTPQQNADFRRAWDATNARWKAQQPKPQTPKG